MFENETKGSGLHKKKRKEKKKKKSEKTLGNY